MIYMYIYIYTDRFTYTCSIYMYICNQRYIYTCAVYVCIICIYIYIHTSRFDIYFQSMSNCFTINLFAVESTCVSSLFLEMSEHPHPIPTKECSCSDASSDCHHEGATLCFHDLLPLAHWRRLYETYLNSMNDELGQDYFFSYHIIPLLDIQFK